MLQMNIPIPEGLPQSLKMSEAEFAKEARMLLATKLYELGKITAGVASQIAGVDRLVFLASLSKYGVPAINIKDEEVGLEIESARRLAEL